jgi:hypothetical protein
MNNVTPKQMHPAAVAQEFMTRTTLKGAEVEAYAQAFNWLTGITTGELVVIPKELHDQLVSRDVSGSNGTPALDDVELKHEEPEEPSEPE